MSYCAVFTWTRTRDHVTIYQILPDNRQRVFSLVPHDEAIPTSHILITIMQNIPDVGAREA